MGTGGLVGYANDVLLLQTDGQELPGRLYVRPGESVREHSGMR